MNSKFPMSEATDWPHPPAGLPAASPVAPDVNPKVYLDIKPWIDEQIWGHRLWDSQSPWLIFLEFLMVAEACERRGEGALADTAPFPLHYTPQQRMDLRNVLFNGEDVVRIAAEHPHDTRAAWDAWRAGMEARKRGVRHSFEYLVGRFHSFDEFARVVQLLRETVVERETNKRWTSRFVFPFGPDAIYEDVNMKEGSYVPNREYINFGRTGEILYIMLCRSAHRSELRSVVQRMVTGTNRWDRLVGSLQYSTSQHRESRRGDSYLPYATHSVFDDLGADWLTISRNRLPGFDAYQHYVTLGAFHVLRYYLQIGATWAESSQQPSLVCEILAPEKTLIRDLAQSSFVANDGVSVAAIETFVDRIGRSATWQRSATGSNGFGHCQSLLSEQLLWGVKYTGKRTPDALLSALRDTALRGHRQHVANIHRSLGRGIGLVSRRGTTRLRYAPADGLLKSLLLANVDHHLELGEFLRRLYHRYGLVIGDREAELALSATEYDKKAFQANGHRLEERLASLGLLRRKSDACAYVVNPFGAAS
jgi:hypothetical protein